jgi:lysophospholipase L1-like esterase
MANAATHIQKEITGSSQAVIPIFSAYPATQMAHHGWITGRIDSLQNLLTPDLLFVSLGGNDAINENFAGAEMIATMIDNIIGAINSETRVYWIPPHTSVGGEREAVYQELVLAADRWANMELLEFYPLPEHLKADGIHFTDSGQVAWSKMIRSAANAALPVDGG